MKNETKPISAKAVFENLPRPLPAETIRKRYGAAMEQVRTLVHESFTRPSAVDVAVETIQRAGSSVLRLLEHAAAVAAEAMQPSPAFAFATRSLSSGSESRSGCSEVKAVKAVNGGRIVVAMKTAGQKVDMQVRLENENGSQLAPMTLTIGDLDTNQTLLSEKLFASGEAVLKGLEPGFYELVAESGQIADSVTIRLSGNRN